MTSSLKLHIIILSISLSSISNTYAQQEDIEVPFAAIENVPIFPGCEKGDNIRKKKCMSDKISKFVNRKFNTNIASKYRLEGKQRINVIFKINKSGNVVGIRSRATHPALEEEAARVIAMLPRMKPGIVNSKPVVVQYALPIIFQVRKTQVPKVTRKPSGNWKPGDPWDSY